MKHVFGSGEVAHVWVHQNHDTWGSNGGSMSFKDDRFFSYSTCVAQRHTNAKGTLYLVTDTRHSPTTSQHVSYIRQALPNRDDAIGVPSCMGCQELIADSKPSLLSAFQYQLERAVEAHQKTGRARSQWQRDQQAGEAQRRIHHADVLRHHFGLRCKLPQDLGTLGAKLAADKQRREARQIKAAEKASRKQLAAWLAGDRYACYPRALLAMGNLTRLRWVPDADQFETSRGIRFSFDEGRLAFAFLRRHRETGWKRNGETYHLAGGDIDSVGKTGVVAGCHRVTWSEIDRVAKEAGLL